MPPLSVLVPSVRLPPTNAKNMAAGVLKTYQGLNPLWSIIPSGPSETASTALSLPCNSLFLSSNTICSYFSIFLPPHTYKWGGSKKFIKHTNTIGLVRKIRLVTSIWSFAKDKGGLAVIQTQNSKQGAHTGLKLWIRDTHSRDSSTSDEKPSMLPGTHSITPGIQNNSS